MISGREDTNMVTFENRSVILEVSGLSYPGCTKKLYLILRFSLKQ